jgi:hypothetical protein
LAVELLEQEGTALQSPLVEVPAASAAGVPLAPPPQLAPAPGVTSEDAELAARRSLRSQIVKLERQLADAFVTAAPMGVAEPALQPSPAQPRLLSLGELELVRDQLTERLRVTRARIAERAERQQAARICLERMLLEPGKYRFMRIPRSELGEPGCGAWEVRPRLGLIGMLMGWWQVKLSSGCPLPGGRGPASVAR